MASYRVWGFNTALTCFYQFKWRVQFSWFYMHGYIEIVRSEHVLFLFWSFLSSFLLLLFTIQNFRERSPYLFVLQFIDVANSGSSLKLVRVYPYTWTFVLSVDISHIAYVFIKMCNHDVAAKTLFIGGFVDFILHCLS